MKFGFFKKKKGEKPEEKKADASLEVKDLQQIDKQALADKFLAKKKQELLKQEKPLKAEAKEDNPENKKQGSQPVESSKKGNILDKLVRTNTADPNRKRLSHEMNRLSELKEKKIFSHDKRKNFTIKGFIKAVNLEENLEKAGIKKDAKQVTKGLLKLNTIICSVLSLIILIMGLYNGTSLPSTILFLVAGWLTFYPLLLALIWGSYLFFIDMKIFNRTKAVEQVFPDFLQLASSNISAGMPVDKALWYAVRPNFGVLAKEIESVAKNTMAGEDLGKALRDFANKYSSKVIVRSINLMLEGLAAGGEMADLLNKIALDIEETRILKKEMAANVTTYVIFITFATILAAPFLFALSTTLLTIIQGITSKMGSTMGSTSSFFSMSFSSESVKISDFRIFSFVTLAISAFSSACIVTMIQKGRIKEGISKIPVYIIISAVLYALSCWAFGGMFGGMLA